MTHPKKVLITTALALVAATSVSGCFFNQEGSSSGSGGGSRPTTGGGGASVGSSTKPSSQGGGNSGGESKGQAEGVIVGSDRVSCDSIDAEIKVTAQGGRTHWSVVPRKSEIFSDATVAQGVTVSPSSGDLDQGKSATVKVRGSYDKANKSFHVYVVYPTSIGSGSRGLEFKCR
jgi:hypothetical protein